MTSNNSYGDGEYWDSDDPPRSRKYAPNGERHEDDIEEDLYWREPDWSLLDDRRGKLPEFPIEVLDPALQDWLKRAARGAGVTPDHVAVPLLSIVSSLIGAARKVRASSSWSVPLSLWTCVVGVSGSGKTPGLDVSRRALSAIERSRRSSTDDLRRAHERRVAESKATHKKWKEDVADAIKANKPAPAKPPAAEDPGEFVAPRFYVNDATIERLAVLNEARKRGMLMICDELAGLFENMTRYSNGSDRQFWLQAWNGAHHVVERINRPPVQVENLLIGLTGGFQPAKLVRSLAGDDDGMQGRFLYAWPREPAYTPLANGIDEVAPEFQEALRRLIDLSTGGGVGDEFVTRHLPLSAEALEDFEQFRQFMHALKGMLDGREREWVSKGDIQVLRLVGTLTYLGWSMRGSQPMTYATKDDPPDFRKLLQAAEEPTEVSREVMARAIKLWREYFWPHARAALRLASVRDEHANHRRALRWIRAHGEHEVSLEDIRREAMSQRLNADQTRELMQELEKAGWLQENIEQTGGRPKHRWHVNPVLLAQEGEAHERKN
jgi:hypothetical protein